MHRVEKLPREALPACASLLEGYPFKPYGHYSHLLDDASLSELFRARLSSTVDQSDTLALWIPSSEGAMGLSTLSHQPWDTEQLGVGVARIDHLIAEGDFDHQFGIKMDLLSAILDRSAEIGARCITARLHASDLSSLQLLEHSGFHTVDGILTFSYDLTEQLTPLPDKDFYIRLSTPDDLEEVKAIARSAFTYDRFHSNPRIDKETADELHANWVQNAVLGRAADAVLVAVSGDRILGFVTCQLDPQSSEYLGVSIGRIILVATAPDDRRLGVAKAITYDVLDWFRDQGVDIVEVGTQFRNIPATRFYASLGFRIVTSSHSLAKWIE